MLNNSEHSLHVFNASSIPNVPVQAFAFPLFTTTARNLFLTCFLHTKTGAALTLLVVNIPVPIQSTSDKTTPKSRTPSFLIPAATPFE